MRFNTVWGCFSFCFVWRLWQGVIPARVGDLELPSSIGQRAARLDFKQGPIFALTKDKRLHVFSDGLMGKQDQPFLLTDLQSITYERAFRVNQLSFQMKPDSGYRSMQFALSTPLSSVDEQLKMLEKMLGSVLPHLKIQRHVSVESALEPLKFTGAFVLLIFIGYVIGGGGYFMSFLCLIALFLDGLYLRTDNEIVSLAFSSMMQTQAGVIRLHDTAVDSDHAGCNLAVCPEAAGDGSQSDGRTKNQENALKGKKEDA